MAQSKTTKTKSKSNPISRAATFDDVYYSVRLLLGRKPSDSAMQQLVEKPLDKLIEGIVKAREFVDIIDAAGKNTALLPHIKKQMMVDESDVRWVKSLLEEGEYPGGVKDLPVAEKWLALISLVVSAAKISSKPPILSAVRQLSENLPIGAAKSSKSSSGSSSAPQQRPAETPAAAPVVQVAVVRKNAGGVAENEYAKLLDMLGEAHLALAKDAEEKELLQRELAQSKIDLAAKSNEIGILIQDLEKFRRTTVKMEEMFENMMGELASIRQ